MEAALQVSPVSRTILVKRVFAVLIRVKEFCAKSNTMVFIVPNALQRHPQGLAQQSEAPSMGDAGGPTSAKRRVRSLGFIGRKDLPFKSEAICCAVGPQAELEERAGCWLIPVSRGCLGGPECHGEPTVGTGPDSGAPTPQVVLPVASMSLSHQWLIANADEARSEAGSLHQSLRVGTGLLRRTPLICNTLRV